MRRYLIVDDNRDFAENLAEIVRDHGDEVSIATSGPEALALAGAARYDAVLTDMRMPFMGGAELVHEIRRIDPGISAMVITAHAGDDALEAARREGLLAVLPKPVPVTRLLELLRAARRDGLVVIIEDDQKLSDNLGEALGGRGFAAVTAASVLETERLGPVRPFCALADLRVPGGPDGEAMRRLTAKFPALPVIVMTAVHEASPPTGQAFFRKPFNTDELLAQVERFHAAQDPAAGRR
jgi:two-component system, response regulator PdtaR